MFHPQGCTTTLARKEESSAIERESGGRWNGKLPRSFQGLRSDFEHWIPNDLVFVGVWE